MPRKTLMSHPGFILKEELDERGLSIQRLARDLRVPPNRIHAIVHGKTRHLG
jgi:plasmid maintenance system antidote protein VapI